MMIVAGHLIVDSSQRESCLTECLSVVERWESQADVETFRGSGPSDEQSTAMLSSYWDSTLRAFSSDRSCSRYGSASQSCHARRR